MAAFAKSVLLAETYDEEMDPTGWWISEKLDGVSCSLSFDPFLLLLKLLLPG